MAVLRLANGNDVTVTLSVEEAISALKVTEDAVEFVEMPTDGGPVFLRPSGILAVIEDAKHGTAGFRVSG